MGGAYDVIIVGGGITGASLLYTLSTYTNVKRILLIEKYGTLAPLNSDSSNNAQTLHYGDIETNYSVDEARRTRRAAEMLVRYSDTIPLDKRKKIMVQCQKMVLGIDDEIKMLDQIYYSRVKELFPGLRYIHKDEIARLEPNVVKDRDPEQKIAALLSDNGRMVDFGKLTHSFVESAKLNRGVKIDIMLGTRANYVKEAKDVYRVYTNSGDFTADFVVFAAGTYSLYFAKSLGYSENLSILSVGGNFYSTRKVLRGKVYTVQIGGIPFAAVHGDPDITNPNVTRFGPTVGLPLELERGHIETLPDYLRSFDFDLETAKSMINIFSNRDITRIVIDNIIYEIPILGKYEFLKKEAATIVPSLRYNDLTFDKNFRGIRPQVIDENKKSLVLGGGKVRGDGMIANITPSPGASSCLASALDDSMYITQYLGRDFFVDKFEKRIGSIK